MDTPVPVPSSVESCRALYLPKDNRAEPTSYMATASNRIQNSLTKANEYLPLEYSDATSGLTTICWNDLRLTAEKDRLKGLKPSALKALDILTSKLSPFDNKACIEVAEYMALRGLKDRKQAKEELKDMGKLTQNMMIVYDSESLTKDEIREYRRRGIEAFSKSFSITEGWLLGTNGIFTLFFSPTYSALLHAYPYMLFHKELFKAPPISYYIGRKLLEQAHILLAKKPALRDAIAPAVTIGIPTLLKAVAALIPSIDDVRSGNRCYKARIIDKLEAALNGLNMGSWEYYTASSEGGTRVEKAAAAGKPIGEWERLTIRYTFSEEYAQELQRRAKTKEIEAALPQLTGGEKCAK